MNNQQEIRTYRAAQKDPLHPHYSTFPVGNVVVGNELVVIAGPCSVEGEMQLMRSACMVKEAGAQMLRGGVVKWRSNPYSEWQGIGAESFEALQRGLSLMVRAGKEFNLPTVVEILDPTMVEVYEDVGINCLQIGEPNSRNMTLLNRLRHTTLPVLHKRGNSLGCEEFLLWTERMMTKGKENIIICERGVRGPNQQHTRFTLDVTAIAAFHQELSSLPVAVDPSHACGRRDLVLAATLAGIMAGASIILVEAHPNPLEARTDKDQALFPEQLRCLIAAAKETWNLRQGIRWPLSATLEGEYPIT